MAERMTGMMKKIMLLFALLAVLFTAVMPAVAGADGEEEGLGTIVFVDVTDAEDAVP